MKIIKLFLVIFVLATLSSILILGYLGFIPAISKMMGTNKPRDLGMVYSQENFASALSKSNVEMKILEPTAKESLRYEGSQNIKASFTDEELTSHAHNRNWVDYPLSEVQVRINDDDTCEVSGMIDLTKVDNLLSALNVSDESYKEALASINVPLAKVPFYAKGSGEIIRNNVTAAVSSFEIGRFPIPSGIITKYTPALESFGEIIIKTIPGADVQVAKFENNSIYLEGTIPNKEFVKTN